MGSNIRVAVLGAGFMGGVHARNMQGIEGASLVAVCDGDPQKLDHLIGELPAGVRGFTDFDDMLDGCDFDALYVAIPPFAHAGQVERAALRGKHVFVEKPIAPDTRRAEAMVQAVKQGGVLSQVGYHARFGRAVRELRRLVDEGKTGAPMLFDGRYECNFAPDSWWKDRSKSGGQVFEQAIHTYDLAMHFLGEPEAVSGFTANLHHTQTPGYTIEDNSVCSIRFRSGALAGIAATNCAVPMEWNNRFSVVFGALTAYFSDPNHAEFVYTGGEQPVRCTVEGDDDMYLMEDIAFIATLQGRQAPVCPIEEGLSSLRLVERMLESADQGGILMTL